MDLLNKSFLPQKNIKQIFNSKIQENVTKWSRNKDTFPIKKELKKCSVDIISSLIDDSQFINLEPQQNKINVNLGNTNLTCSQCGEVLITRGNQSMKSLICTNCGLTSYEQQKGGVSSAFLGGKIDDEDSDLIEIFVTSDSREKAIQKLKDKEFFESFILSKIIMFLNYIGVQGQVLVKAKNKAAQLYQIFLNDNVKINDPLGCLIAYKSIAFALDNNSSSLSRDFNIVVCKDINVNSWDKYINKFNNYFDSSSLKKDDKSSFFNNLNLLDQEYPGIEIAVKKELQNYPNISFHDKIFIVYNILKTGKSPSGNIYLQVDRSNSTSKNYISQHFTNEENVLAKYKIKY